MSGSLDRQFGPNFKKVMQGSTDHRIGLNYKKGIQGSTDRRIGLNFKKEIHGSNGPPNRNEFSKGNVGILGLQIWSKF